MSSPESQVDPILARLDGKNMGVTSVLLTSAGSLGSKPVRRLCSARRPNCPPGRRSQWMSPCERRCAVRKLNKRVIEQGRLRVEEITMLQKTPKRCVLSENLEKRHHFALNALRSVVKTTRLLVSIKLSKKMLILAMTKKSIPFLGRPSTFRISGTTVLDVVGLVGLEELLISRIFLHCLRIV